MISQNFPKTYVLESAELREIFSESTCHSLDIIDIHTFSYLVGPLFVDNNHWNAVIIDMTSDHLYVIDPMHKIQKSKFIQREQAWIKYYLNRKDAKDKTWKLKNNCEHPKQQDSFNCGPLTCLIIEQFVCHKEPTEKRYNASHKSMREYRSKMASDIKLFFENLNKNCIKTL